VICGDRTLVLPEWSLAPAFPVQDDYGGRYVGTFYLLAPKLVFHQLRSRQIDHPYEDAYDLFVPHGRASHGIGVHLTGMCLMGVYLIGVICIS
jgi:hypothetical protein